MKYQDLFVKPKPVMAMIHLKGDSCESVQERARREIDIYLNCGVDAVLVENYFGSAGDVGWTLKYLQEHLPGATYGVNVLGDYRRAFELAGEYGAKYIQIDSVCGHLRPKEDERYAEELASLRGQCDVVLLGGVRFKYQPVRSGREQDEDVALGMKRCDAIVVTGEGTGMATPVGKVKDFRTVAGDFPLIIGAGVTPNRLREGIGLCDGFIVGSWFKEGHKDYGEVSEAYVREFMKERQRLLGEMCLRREDICAFSGDFAFLSMKASAPIEMEGITYSNLTAAWLAQGVPAEYRHEFAGKNAHQARRLFKQLPRVEDWSTISEAALKRACRAKFNRNPVLMEKLLATGSRRIIYDTTGSHDNDLGRCTCEVCRNQEAKNLYGKILMDIRSDGLIEKGQ